MQAVYWLDHTPIIMYVHVLPSDFHSECMSGLLFIPNRVSVQLLVFEAVLHETQSLVRFVHICPFSIAGAHTSD